MTNKTTFPAKLLKLFVELVLEEVGADHLPIVLQKSDLPTSWADSEAVAKLNDTDAAEAYAGLQKAIRTYYGRSARGTLKRIGSDFFNVLLENASFKEKTQSKLLRGLPSTPRRKAALEMLIRLLDPPSGGMSAHTLDLNLMLVDNHSPSTLNQKDDEAICYVTLGLIREAIYWAMGEDAHIEETSCKVLGDESCEFTILFGES